MSRTQKKATEIGLAISDRISKAGLAYIRLKDLDLYDAIMEANKERSKK
jgi:hypothetical protein